MQPQIYSLRCEGSDVRILKDSRIGSSDKRERVKGSSKGSTNGEDGSNDENATLHMARSRMVASAVKPETYIYKNGGTQRNGTVRRQSGSSGYCGTNEARGIQW